MRRHKHAYTPAAPHAIARVATCIPADAHAHAPHPAARAERSCLPTIHCRGRRRKGSKGEHTAPATSRIHNEALPPVAPVDGLEMAGKGRSVGKDASLH